MHDTDRANARILHAPADEAVVDALVRETAARHPARPQHLATGPATIERDLARLVLGLVDVLRRTLELQAIRRVEGGSLTDDQIEDLGLTFLKLEERMAELRATFGLTEADLALNLGGVRDLLDEALGDAPGEAG
jgi:hypothetical protein